MLEVYSDLDKHRLRESVSEDWHLLDNNDVSKNNKDAIVEDDTFVFGTDRDFEREKLIGEMKSATIETITFTIGEKKAGEKKEDEQEEEVNFDDI